MRSKLICVIVIVFAVSLNIYSQPKPPSTHERLVHLKEVLNLSESQAKNVETILENTKQKMRSIMDKAEKQNDAVHDEIREIMDNEDQSIKNILDDSQKEKFDELVKERKQHRPPMGERQRPPRG